MANRVFVSTVIVLWLSSMTWLVSQRILPSFYQGQPPVADALEIGVPVAWHVEWGGRDVGVAASVRVPGIAGTTELHNRMTLHDVPLMDLAPTWMRTAVGNIGSMTLDALTRFEFDSFGNFSAFESEISLNELPSVLKIAGRVDGTYLKLKIRSADLSHATEVYLPDRRILNEALFPDAHLQSLQVGRRWQEEVYSPFSAPGEPVELVQAEVVSQESMEYHNEIVRVLRVEYRGLPGSGVSQNAQVQARAWVTPEGDVLRRDVYFGRSKLRFNRLKQEDANQIGARLFKRLDIVLK